jgi:hypothetical protein
MRTSIILLTLLCCSAFGQNSTENEKLKMENERIKAAQAELGSLKVTKAQIMAAVPNPPAKINRKKLRSILLRLAANQEISIDGSSFNWRNTTSGITTNKPRYRMRRRHGGNRSIRRGGR